MENVKGLLSSEVGQDKIFRNMRWDLEEPASALGELGDGGPRYALYSLVREPLGYDFDSRPKFNPSDFVIRCEDYGIPQSRHRVIILGVLKDTIPDSVPVLQQRRGDQVRAGQVLTGLPRLRSGLSRIKDGESEWRDALNGIFEDRLLEDIPKGRSEGVRAEIRRTLDCIFRVRADRGGEFVACDAPTEYERNWYYSPELGGVCNHVSRPHIVPDLHRYLFATSYATVVGHSPELPDFPPRLLPKHKNIGDSNKAEYFDDRFRVQVPDKPSTTITSHLSKDGHYFIHYDGKQCRSLTVREAARLQTFPDNYMLLRYTYPAVHSGRQRGSAFTREADRGCGLSDSGTGEVPRQRYFVATSFSSVVTTAPRVRAETFVG
jgi:DNA (cytosine-5)-methyltransferase 1